MPNPRITFRVPPELLAQLPANADERSRFCLEAITDKLDPSPAAESSALLSRIEALEALVEKLMQQKSTRKKAPPDIEEAINHVLVRIQPRDRVQAKKVLNQLRSVLS